MPRIPPSRDKLEREREKESEGEEEKDGKKGASGRGWGRGKIRRRKEEEETVQACNPSIWDAQTGWSQVPGPKPAWVTQGDFFSKEQIKQTKPLKYSLMKWGEHL